MIRRFLSPVGSFLKSFPEAAGAIAILGGSLVLVGWALDIPTLKSVIPGQVSMKANTALGFILAGMSLWLLHADSALLMRYRKRRIAQACAFALSLLGLLTLTEYVFGRNLGIDQWLFREPPGAVGTSSPGRMAPTTAFNFLLVGLALLLLNVKTRRGHHAAQFLALTAAFVALLALIGYTYGSTAFYGIASYTKMASHTAAMFVLLCAGILAACPESPLTTILRSDSTGGVMARRLLPAAFFIPLLLGWLRLMGQRVGLYDTELGAALFAVSSVLIFVVVIWWNSRLLHRMDIERKRAEQVLRQQKEIQQSILDSMGDGVVVADQTGKFLLFNPAAERILGMGPTDATPEKWTTQYGVYLPDRITPYPAAELPLARAIRGEAVDGAELFVRHSKLPQGVWLNVTARPLRDENRSLRGGVVVLRDVTSSKQAEQALRLAKEEAERTSKFKDQFLSTMSHELRTPLNAILGFSELLQEERYGPLNERQGRYMKHINAGGKHLLRLINDILDLSKIEAGRFELAIESVPVEQAVAEVLSALEPLTQQKSQKLSWQVGPGLAVRADATRFKQILMNLLGNAIKFTPQDGRIELTARLVDTEVRVEVRDTGPGIPAEEQKRIFEAFYRLPQGDRLPEGTGLGLAITKRLVEMQRGRLNLDSEPGRGSSFYFSLPAVEAIPAMPCEPAEVRSRTTELPRIMVLEDDLAARQLIQLQLTSSGYEVILCQHPERATEIAAELKPDAITLDLLMKPVDGLQLLLQLKNDPRTVRIPVIVLTIVDQPAIGLALGADEYLVKPVERSTLLAAVERRLAARAARQATQPILVVEDDSPTREIITELLTTEGYSVATASDGAQARAWVAHSLPELIILDLLLPEVSGFELLADWRANPRTANLPVFVLTSKDLTREEEKYLRTHAESLFRKQQPWQQALVDELRRFVGHDQPVKG